MREFGRGGRAISSGRWEVERGIGLIQVGTQGKDGGQRGEIWLVAGSNSAGERGREIDKMRASRVGLEFQRSINLQVNSN